MAERASIAELFADAIDACAPLVEIVSEHGARKLRAGASTVRAVRVAIVERYGQAKHAAGKALELRDATRDVVKRRKPKARRKAARR